MIRETTFKTMLPFLHTKSLLNRKGVYMKRNENCPLPPPPLRKVFFPPHPTPPTHTQWTRSKFFPFKSDPFSERTLNNFNNVVSLESVPIPIKWAAKGIVRDSMNGQADLSHWCQHTCMPRRYINVWQIK